MQLLKDRIISEGKVIGDNIIKVDSFLNHQIDPVMIVDIGREFAARFRHDEVTKILTLEASGIAIAFMTGLELGVPVLFAKKARASTQDGAIYSSSVHSFTKDETYDIAVNKEYICEDDKILIIDDFLADGKACGGLIGIVKQAGAELVGIGIVIEKVFQGGGNVLRDANIRVESLASIARIEDGKAVFADD